MKTIPILSVLVLCFAACAGPDPGDTQQELGQLEQASYSGENWSSYLHGVDVSATTFGQRRSQCASTHTDQFCLVPSRGAFVTQSGETIFQYFIWVSDNERDLVNDDFTVAPLVSTQLANYIKNWIQDLNNASVNVWRAAWPDGIWSEFIKTKFLNTPGGIPQSLQGRIGGEQNGGTGGSYDRTQASSYLRVEGEGCGGSAMGETPNYPGTWYQCQRLKVRIWEARIEATAQHWQTTAGIPAATTRAALRWQIAGQAVLMTQGIGTTSYDELWDPMRRVVYPLADNDEVDEFFVKLQQQCMLAHRFASSPGDGNNLQHSLVSGNPCSF